MYMFKNIIAEQLNICAGLPLRPSTDKGALWLGPLLNKCVMRYYPHLIND
ncbi:MAG: hypothetical protein Q8942_07745 [Bacillota bacterium]|nr:hypothetical protein [Bacillota bacterium]